MIAYNEKVAKDIIAYETSKGLNGIIISGDLANKLAESALDSGNAQNGPMATLKTTDAEYIRQVDAGTWKRPDNGKDFVHDSIGFGLCQWTSAGRKEGLYNLVKSRGVSIADFRTQMDWFWEELSSSKSLMNELMACNTPEEAAILIMVKFERPAKKDDPAKQKLRADYARHFYDKYFAASESTQTTPEKILVISAGHGHNTAGKRIPLELNPDDVREWDLNQRIACYTQIELEKYDGIKIVRLDDTTGRTDVPLATRAKESDRLKADMYLAFHHNAAGRIFKGGGIVVFHYPLERNQKQATELYNTLIKYTGLVGNRSRKVVPTTELYEVRMPKADAYLIEHGFMDSTVDEPIIITDEFAHQCAKAHCEFIVNLWGLKLKNTKPSANEDVLNRISYLKEQIATLQKELADLEASL